MGGGCGRRWALGVCSRASFHVTTNPTKGEVIFDNVEIELKEGVVAGGAQPIRVVVTQNVWEVVSPRIRPRDDVKPEAIYEDLNILEVDPRVAFAVNCHTQLVTVSDDLPVPAISAFRLLAARLKAMGLNNPILLKDCLNVPAPALSPQIALLRSSVVLKLFIGAARQV